MLDYVDSASRRKHVHQALNRGESYHKLRRAVSYANFGKLRFKTEYEQEIWNECARLISNCSIFYNATILSRLWEHRKNIGDEKGAAEIVKISPVAWQCFNFCGHFAFRGRSELYQAFAELGRLVRTVFLLNFIGDAELRHTVTTATNTSETWNGFTKWIAFGGDGVIRQSSREEQRKFIRYNHIAANLIVFHNTVSMTRVLQQLVDEGYPVTKEILARFSPCKIGHINRFGQIEMRFDQPPDPLIEDLRL